MGFSLGGGSSKGEQKVELTPEQRRLLGAQTDFLTGTAFPAYQGTIGKAEQALAQASPEALSAASAASGVAGRAAAAQEAGGLGSYFSGLSKLSQLFSPQFKQEQVAAALQPAQEAVREEMAAQGALFGGAGGGGSARQALAARNLASLSTARLGNVAAQVSSGVEQQRQRAAESLLAAGQAGLQGAQQAAASRVALAQTPQDLISKYAAVIYGVPQANTTADFRGTQSTSGSSSGKGFGIKA